LTLCGRCAHTKSCNKKDDERKVGIPSVRKVLIVGLGNPGSSYTGTRHNIGFLVLDQLVLAAGMSWTNNRKKALVARTVMEHADVVCVKPQTFMNLSGKAVYHAVQKHGIPLGDIIVVHDDIDLDPGTIRLKVGGGDGGHKGVRSIADSLKGRDFVRIRLGVGRPTGGLSAEAYVLQKFERDEKPLVSHLVATALEAVRMLLNHDLHYTRNIIHSRRFEVGPDLDCAHKNISTCQSNEVVII